MRRLPLKLQILAAPLALAVPTIVFVIFILFYLNDISRQNDTIREWARATDQLKIARSADYQMLHILGQLKPEISTEQREELFFNYIEQSQLLTSSLSANELKDKISTETQKVFDHVLEKTRYTENLDVEASILALQKLTPKLDYAYNTLQAKKRTLYVNSNQDINDITSKLSTLILSVLGIATLISLIIALYVSNNLKRRFASISQYATDILQGNFKTLAAPENINDELDQLTERIAKMSQRLTHSIESERILQSAEDERQRIAMDIHDQFLSEISHLRREIEQSRGQLSQDRQLLHIDRTLERLNTELRSLINDLFPHSLEMLGLEASLREYVERKLAGIQNIEYYIQVDEEIDSMLNSKQCLHIYRIAIEAISNILKHAFCSRFELVFKVINNKPVLTIEDNGCGFNFNKTEVLGHIGLLSIKQRASILDSEASWSTSRFSSGTCFKLTLDSHIPEKSSKTFKHEKRTKSYA